MLTFRRVVEANRERICEISSQIWEGDDYIPFVFDKWLLDMQGEFTAAFEGDKLIGFAKYTLVNDGSVWLEGIRADVSYRGMGFGDEMTKYYIEKARQENVQALRLSTYIENYGSIHIIEKNSFKKDGYFTFLYRDIEEDFDKTMPDNVVNIMSSGAAWHFITSSRFYMMSNAYINHGWRFEKMTYERLESLVKNKRVFGTIQDGRMTALLILTEDSNGDGGYSIGFLEGDLTGMKKLIDFSLSWSKQSKGKYVSTMAPLNDDLINVLTLSGFKGIYENPRDVNVFVYTRKII